eukprot:TRINITY_DN24626_c0_g1_i1.p2 TRINITY_DN24626_c0_g1~~TRINITY_DN24626_c0_g1_i1.p2  ORF type:complete len:204 (+),score=36.11 TRINITY_DN24626_c0_g1_i1:52-663(+)
MGNCSSAYTEPRNALKSNGRSALKRVKAPSGLPRDIFVGDLPDDPVYRDFYWYLTSYQMGKGAGEMQKTWKRNRFMKFDGKMRGTVDDVSAVVTAVEDLPYGHRRTYHLECHSSEWRSGLASWLLRQNIHLVFDFEPANPAEHAAHKRLRLYETGYSFTFSFLDYEMDKASSYPTTTAPSSTLDVSQTTTPASSSATGSVPSA